MSPKTYFNLLKNPNHGIPVKSVQYHPEEVEFDGFVEGITQCDEPVKSRID